MRQIMRLSFTPQVSHPVPASPLPAIPCPVCHPSRTVRSRLGGTPPPPLGRTLYTLRVYVRTLPVKPSAALNRA